MTHTYGNPNTISSSLWTEIDTLREEISKKQELLNLYERIVAYIDAKED